MNDQEINALFAEKVAGWKMAGVLNYGTPPNENGQYCLPDFLHSADATCYELDKLPWHSHRFPRTGTTKVEIWNELTNETVWAEGRSLPHAGVLALLKFRGVALPDHGHQIHDT